MENYELKNNENSDQNDVEKKTEKAKTTRALNEYEEVAAGYTMGSINDENHLVASYNAIGLDARPSGKDAISIPIVGAHNHVEQVPGDRSLPDPHPYEGDVWEYYPGVKKRPKLNQDSLVNLVFNLKERVERLENASEEKDEVLQKKIAKGDMEKMVIEAISNGNTEYGVSKGFLKSFLMHRYKLHWSAHYQKKLSIDLHGLIDKKMILFDTANQLFKATQY